MSGRCFICILNTTLSPISILPHPSLLFLSLLYTRFYVGKILRRFWEVWEEKEKKNLNMRLGKISEKRYKIRVCNDSINLIFHIYLVLLGAPNVKQAFKQRLFCCLIVKLQENYRFLLQFIQNVDNILLSFREHMSIYFSTISI